MARYRELGEWLRKIRISKGIRSAAELGRRAKLGASHIAMFERGEFRPRWRTFTKVVKALGLNPEESAEANRIWDATGKPAAVQEATLAIPIPGLIIWRHFPALLYGKKDQEPWPFYVDPDRLAVQAVRSVGSLLSWVALTENPPPESKRKELCNRAISIRLEAEESHHPERPDADQALATTLPCIWREQVFGSRRSTAEIVDLLANWSYYPPVGRYPFETINAHFDREDLAAKYTIEAGEPDDIVDLHEAMIAVQFAKLLGPVVSQFIEGAGLGYYSRRLHAFGQDVGRVLACRDEHAFSALFPSPHTKGEMLGNLAAAMATAVEPLRAVRRSRLAARALGVPALAEQILGKVARMPRDQFLATASQVEVWALSRSGQFWRNQAERRLSEASKADAPAAGQTPEAPLPAADPPSAPRKTRRAGRRLDRG